MSSRGEVLPSFLPASGIEFRNFYITSTFAKHLLKFPLLYRECLLFACRHYFNLILSVESCSEIHDMYIKATFFGS